MIHDLSISEAMALHAADIPPPPIPNISTIAILGAILNAPWAGGQVEPIAY